jgi:hypothetical protein
MKWSKIGKIRKVTVREGIVTNVKARDTPEDSPGKVRA